MAKFFRRGVTKVRFLPAVAAATLVPTRAEITAGTDLSTLLAAIDGWELQNNPIPTPDMADAFTGNIPGEDTASDSSLTFYDDDASTTKRTTLAKGTAGFIYVMPYGDVSGKRAETFPIRVTRVTDEKTVGNDPARFVVGVAITAPPNVANTNSVPV